MGAARLDRRRVGPRGIVSGFGEGQLAVARLLFGLPEAQGFALAGGSALLALGAIDRPTRDIDAFVGATGDTPPGDVGPLLAALRIRLDDEGWTVTVDREHTTFARLVAVQAHHSVEIDLAVDSQPLFPIEIALDLPVLAGQDLAARKVLAILDRAEARDFTDLRTLAERYSPAECIRWASELDDGVRAPDIAHAFEKLDRLDDAELPCDPGAVANLRAWYQRWSLDLLAGYE